MIGEPSACGEREKFDVLDAVQGWGVGSVRPASSDLYEVLAISELVREHEGGGGALPRLVVDADASGVAHRPVQARGGARSLVSAGDDDQGVCSQEEPCAPRVTLLPRCMAPPFEQVPPSGRRAYGGAVDPAPCPRAESGDQGRHAGVRYIDPGTPNPTVPVIICAA